MMPDASNTVAGGAAKKRWMPRYSGGSTEIVVCVDEKTVYLALYPLSQIP